MQVNSTGWLIPLLLNGADMRNCFGCLLLALILIQTGSTILAQPVTTALQWSALPDYPNELGVAGPFVGSHENVLIVAGGANFPRPVWESNKRWESKIYVMRRSSKPNRATWSWGEAGDLPRKAAYGACVSTPQGVVCIGGNDDQSIFADCLLLKWNSQSLTVEIEKLPNLPTSLAYAAATAIGQTVYIFGGQTSTQLNSATNRLWAITLGGNGLHTAWRELPPCPASPRAFHQMASQTNGHESCIYVVGGRCEQQIDSSFKQAKAVFLADCWEFSPQSERWRKRADAPRVLAAGSAISLEDGCVAVLSGDDGKLFERTEELRDDHPGFPRTIYTYHPATDSWRSLGESPVNQVTTPAIHWDDSIVLVSGEIRPRVRTPKVWRID